VQVEINVREPRPDRNVGEHAPHSVTGTVSRRFQRAPILIPYNIFSPMWRPSASVALRNSPYGRGGATRVRASRRQRSHHKEKAGFESIVGADCGVVVFIHYGAEATNLPHCSTYVRARAVPFLCFVQVGSWLRNRRWNSSKKRAHLAYRKGKISTTPAIPLSKAP
jgi:hypothetical protein